MKKPFVAFLLSFFLPGAGLWYLGKWKAGFVNLGIVLLIGMAAAVLVPDDLFERVVRYLSFGLAGGSAAYAQMMAKQQNDQAEKPAVTP